jgi:putative endonuclease
VPRPGYVYVLASGRYGTLYIGVTSDLSRRIGEHKRSEVPGFTRKYGVHTLVHVESFDDIRDAITREKQLKKWNRAWKIRLVEAHNPEWQDLSDLL